MDKHILTNRGIGAVALFSAAVLLLGCGSLVAAGTVVDTSASWPGWNVGYWGAPPITATHGQTFTVGTDTRLDSFTFYVAHDVNYDPLIFAAYVMRWDASRRRATGPVLFQSGVLTAPPLVPSGGCQPLTVSTGGLELTAGQQYVAFFSTSIVHSGDGRGWVGYAGDLYAGGAFVYIDNGTDFSALTSRSWVQDYPDVGGDLAFTMAFNVPEPGSLVMLLAACVAGLRRPAIPARCRV